MMSSTKVVISLLFLGVHGLKLNSDDLTVNSSSAAGPALQELEKHMQMQVHYLEDSKSVGVTLMPHSISRTGPALPHTLSRLGKEVFPLVAEAPMQVWVTNAVGAVLVILSFSYMRILPHSSPMMGYCSILCYLCFSVLIDTNISVASDGGRGFKFEPACSVLLVEVGKWIASFILYSLGRWQPVTVNGEPFIQADMRWKDAFCLAVPGLLFAINNILVYLSIGHNEIASFGVFRDTIIFFNALIWCFVFKSTLGMQRNLALCGVFVGLCSNQIMPLLTASLCPFLLVILLMAFTNACGSVANEYAIKMNSGLDLNLQNLVLYTFCIFWALLYIAILKPDKLSSFGAFFECIDTMALLICFLQLSAGLMVSRILKYADSVTKNVACSLRGPILIFLAPLLGLNSRLDFFTATSAFIVGGASCYFLMLGKPAPGINLDEEVELEKAKQSGER